MISPDPVLVQRRVLRLLFATQVLGGIGVGIGGSVGVLLAADTAGIAISGLVSSATVVGAALLAVPAAEVVARRGRRLSLAGAYLIAALGAVLVVVAAMSEVTALLLASFVLFGGATAASLQARYAAVDLAPTHLRARQLSTIVWATTLGAVAGPNLAPLAGMTLHGLGVPTLAGPFVFSAVLFVAAALLLVVLLNPDPALLARRVAIRPQDEAPRKAGLRVALAAIASDPSARLGVSAMAIGHVVMVAVMAMTPVHVLAAGYEPAHTLRIVGLVISLHIAGMFAFSPGVGWLSDRFGRGPIIRAGALLLLVSCVLAAGAGHDSARLAAGLMILGLGWSFTMIAGSTLLSESVPIELRTSAQGLSDLAMGLAGATAGALSGLIMGAWGFATLTLVAAVVTTVFVGATALRVGVGGPDRAGPPTRVTSARP